MDEFLHGIRTQLGEEIARLRGQADILERIALATIEAAPPAEVVETPAVVRPPTPIVPAEPVKLPKAPKREHRPAAKGQKREARPTPDYPRIVATIRDAMDRNIGVRAELCRVYGVPRTTAANWTARCRQLGLLDGNEVAQAAAQVAVAPGRPVDGAHPMIGAGRTKVLACTEDGCEFTCAPERGTIMINHVRDKHGRRATDGERSPVLEGAAA